MLKQFRERKNELNANTGTPTIETTLGVASRCYLQSPLKTQIRSSLTVNTLNSPNQNLILFGTVHFLEPMRSDYANDFTYFHGWFGSPKCNRSNAQFSINSNSGMKTFLDRLNIPADETVNMTTSTN